MASDVMSLFNMPTQEQLGQQYLEGMLTTPQQLGAQGLLQQVVSLGGNAGSMLGYGVGRMMGGMTADEVRAKGIDDAMRTVQGLGLTSDAEMYGALSKELANKGLTQDALKARNAGLEAKKAEETMRINQARLGIAQEELKLRQNEEARAAAKAPLEIKRLTLDNQKLEDSLKPLEQQYAEASSEIMAMRQNGEASPADLERAIGKANGLKREIEAKQTAIDLNKAHITYYEKAGEAAVKNASAAQARASQDVVSGKITMPIADITGKITNVPIGVPIKNGKIMGTGTGKVYTQDEWDDGGMFAEEKAVKAKLMPTPTTTPKPETKKEPTKPISSFDMSLGTAP
ncbi:MAG: hypothetical protein ACO22M_00470 [Candidatus Nanopelagicaceae bacterium]